MWPTRTYQRYASALPPTHLVTISRYQAAQQTNLGFKLFLSLDMTSLPCVSTADAQNLRTLVNAQASHPNQYQYDSRVFVSTFSGETCQFGQGNVTQGWKSQFTQHPELQGKIYFVPSFFVDPTTFKDYSGIMDGDFNVCIELQLQY